MKRIAVWLPLVYLLVTCIALALPFMVDAPEAGIWAVILTLPWPIVLVPVIDGIDPGLMDSGLGRLGLGAGAVANALLLYVILRRLERRRE